MATGADRTPIDRTEVERKLARGPPPTRRPDRLAREPAGGGEAPTPI